MSDGVVSTSVYGWTSYHNELPDLESLLSNFKGKIKKNTADVPNNFIGKIMNLSAVERTSLPVGRCLLS